jgi:hypothetical protein
LIVPLLVALGAVALGTAIGLGLGARALSAARVLAALVAVAAVGLQLAPEAIAEVGLWALAALAGGLAVPLMIEWAGQRLLASVELGASLALELAYAGLLLHQIGDGVALGTLASGHVDHGHAVSILALGGHAIAMSAVFVLAFRDARGRVNAALRGLGMALAIGGGALGVGLLPAELVVSAHPWVAAVTSGLLLHVALHPVVHLFSGLRRAPESGS